MSTRRARIHIAHPAWVLFNGELTHVSAFRAYPRGRRPLVRCPECDLPVRLHLGPRNVHHFAHPPGAQCIVTQPETALHLNAKFHIAKELRGGGPGNALMLAIQCLVGRHPRDAADKPSDVPWHEWDGGRCGQTNSQNWGVDWDDVKVEQRLGSLESLRRPDVLLLRNGHPVAAIEVFVTHAVDADKAAILASLGLPWVEVLASDVLPSYGVSRQVEESDKPVPPDWTYSQPLPVFRESAVWRWRCPAHQQSYDAWLEDLHRERLEAERRAAQDAERARHTTRLVALRIVDAMYPSGKHYRHLYRVEERSTDGVPRTIALMLNEKVLVELRLKKGRERLQWETIKRRCNRDIEWVKDHSVAVDCPMLRGQGWLRGPVAERAWARASVRPDKPFKYPLGYHFPRRYRFSGETDEWFIPPDLKSVKWDREADDDFARHPASRRQLTPSPASQGLRRSPLRGNATKSTFGGRLSAADLGVVINRIVEKTSFRIFGLEHQADFAAPRVAIVVPCGKAYADEVARTDSELALHGILRLWISPPGDWSRQIAGVPWLPVRWDSAKRLVPPSNSGYESLSLLIRAFARGELTPDDVVGWDERASLLH